MTPVLFLVERLSAVVLAIAVAVHLATILYAIRGGLTAGEILARTHGNLGFFAFYSVFVAAVARWRTKSQVSPRTVTASPAAPRAPSRASSPRSRRSG